MLHLNCLTETIKAFFRLSPLCFTSQCSRGGLTGQEFQRKQVEYNHLTARGTGGFEHYLNVRYKSRKRVSSKAVGDGQETSGERNG